MLWQVGQSDCYKQEKSQEMSNSHNKHLKYMLKYSQDNKHDFLHIYFKSIAKQTYIQCDENKDLKIIGFQFFNHSLGSSHLLQGGGGYEFEVQDHPTFL